MVFGWGKKKEAPPVREETEVKTVALDEIDSVLSNHKEVRQTEIIHEAKPRFETIKKEIRAIISIAEHLKKDDLKLDDVDTRLRVIVTRGKKDVVETVSKEAVSDLPSADTFESVVKCSEISMHSLKKIGDVLGRNTRIIHIFAKKYANDLKMHLETLSTNQSHITDLINEISDFDSKVSEIKEKKSRLLSAEQEIKEKKSNLDSFIQQAKDSSARISDLEQELESRKKSSEYARFEKSKNTLEHLMDEQRHLYKEIDDEFSKISRPLGKYVYVTSLDKQLKSLLESLTGSAAKTITKENKDSVVKVLESCMKGVMSGTVSVKENDKTVDHITHVISILDDLIQKKSQHEDRIKDIKEQISSFDSDGLAGLEKQLDTTRQDKKHAEEKTKSLSSEIEQLQDQNERILDEISSLVNRATGKNYKISR